MATRLYKDFWRVDSLGAKTAVDVISASVKTYDMSSVEIESFASTTQEATGRYYVTLGDSYLSGTKYYAVWTFVLVAGHTQMDRSYFMFDYDLTRIETPIGVVVDKGEIGVAVEIDDIQVAVGMTE